MTFQIGMFNKQTETLRRRMHDIEEDYGIMKKSHESAAITIDKQTEVIKRRELESAGVQSIIEDLKADKQRQKDEFTVLQAKALKMTNTLKKLAANISSYLDENRRLKKQIERAENRQSLGFLDMTPRPNYQEIFVRRGFKHYKENMGLKIMQQHYSSAEVVEELIDMIKVLESKSHFAKSPVHLGLDTIKSSKPKNDPSPTNSSTKRKTRQKFDLSIREVPDSRPILTGSRRIAPLEGVPVPRDSNMDVSRSSLNNSVRIIRPWGPVKEEVPSRGKSNDKLSGRRSVDSGMSESDSSLGSVVSKLSKDNYQLIRTIQGEMEDINKDLVKLVHI